MEERDTEETKRKRHRRQEEKRKREDIDTGDMERKIGGGERGGKKEET